jgi:hypothetical protein
MGGEFDLHNIGGHKNYTGVTFAGNGNFWLKTKAKTLRLLDTKAHFAFFVNSKVAACGKVGILFHSP